MRERLALRWAKAQPSSNAVGVCLTRDIVHTDTHHVAIFTAKSHHTFAHCRAFHIGVVFALQYHVRVGAVDPLTGAP